MALTSNVHNIGGRAERAHVPPMPLWVVIIRIFQLVLAIIILGLAAEAFNVYHPYENSVGNVDASAYGFGGFALTGCRMVFFTFSWTFLYLIYLGVTFAFLDTFYHMWAHLGLEILTCLWWLISFALLANDASNLNNLENISFSEYGSSISIADVLPSQYTTALNCEKAAAGLGALEWLLFVLTLVMLALALLNHRRAYGTGTGPAATSGAAMTEEHKMDTMNTAQPVHVQDPRYAQ